MRPPPTLIFGALSASKRRERSSKSEGNAVMHQRDAAITEDGTCTVCCPDDAAALRGDLSKSEVSQIRGNFDDVQMSGLLRDLFRHSSSSSSEDDEAAVLPHAEPPTSSSVAQPPPPSPPFVVFQFSPLLRVSLPVHSPDNPLASSLAFKIWRSSLVAATRVAQQQTLNLGCGAEATWSAQLSSQLLDCRGKRVLELGCGQGLVGLVAGQLGASSVTLTDIRDEALVALQTELQQQPHAPPPAAGSQGEPDTAPQEHQQCSFHVRHLLWEQDRLALDHMDTPPTVEETGAASGALELDWRQLRLQEAAGFAELPHWSSGCRQPSIPVLSPCERFDVIIAADCLYFPNQEDGLCASLLLRMQRPHGTALVVFQPRNNNGACIVRLAAGLRAEGMHVLHEKGPWCHGRMAEDHLFGVPGHQGACQRGMDSPHRTTSEQGEVEMLTCAWTPLPAFPHGVQCC